MNERYQPHLLGPEGELLATNYLVAKGYKILQRNYRFHHNEIDIIAEIGSTLCFVEVKCRFSSAQGNPAEAVTRQKQKEIIKAAQAYLVKSGNTERDCRFDVITIIVHTMQYNHIAKHTLNHLIDAFWVES